MQADNSRRHRRNQPLGRHPSPPITWALAIVVPVLAAAALFFWLQLTGTAQQSSETCGPHGLVAGVGVWVLLFAGPGATICYARHARPLLQRILCPAVLSALVSVPLAFVAYQAWWGYQGCYL